MTVTVNPTEEDLLREILKVLKEIRDKLAEGTISVTQRQCWG
jgi:hypothetical protein